MQKYHISIRVIHWIMAALIIGMLGLGFFLEETKLYSLHKSIGVLILALIIIRLIARNVTKTPAMPVQIKPIEGKLAKLGHYSLYLLVLLMPISGWLMSNWSGRGVGFFGIAMPILVEKNKELAGLAYEAHEIIAYLLIFMISAHVAGYLKHLIVDKLNLLRRIL